MLKNLVRSEVRSEVRVRKKCLNHPAAAKRGCCQSTERFIKIVNENLVRGEVRMKCEARTRTNGLRKSPPDCRVAGTWKRTDSLPGRTAEAMLQAKVQGCNFRKRNILESVFRVEAAEQQLDIGRHFARCSEASMTLSNGGRQQGKQERLAAWVLRQKGARAAEILILKNAL